MDAKKVAREIKDIAKITGLPLGKIIRTLYYLEILTEEQADEVQKEAIKLPEPDCPTD